MLAYAAWHKCMFVGKHGGSTMHGTKHKMPGSLTILQHQGGAPAVVARTAVA